MKIEKKFFYVACILEFSISWHYIIMLCEYFYKKSYLDSVSTAELG